MKGMAWISGFENNNLFEGKKLWLVIIPAPERGMQRFNISFDKYFTI